MLRRLLTRFWQDESGAVVATEYLMLGSIVAMGSAAGMAAMRDSIVDEYKEFGQSTRELRQSYSAAGQTGGAGRTQGSAASNGGTARGAHAAPPAADLRFNCPVP